MTSMGPGHHHGHAHAHGHGHGHAHGASRGGDPARNRRRVGIAAVLTGSFMVAEAVAGMLSGSLALIADAGHMLADAASLSLAWIAFRVAERPHDWTRTYGFHRVHVLAAYTNGLTLFFVTIAIVVEAVHRLREPVTVLGGPMLVVAVLGIVVNLLAFAALHGADRDNLNIKGALLHVVGDLLGSVAAIVAAIVILVTGWSPIDPLLSVVVSLLILRSAWMLIRDSGHILLEAAPRELDVEAMRNDLAANVEGVEDVHHVHAWSLTQERPMVTLHARISEAAGPGEAARISAAIKVHLRARYGITHATVEIEHGECADAVGPEPPANRH
ncbi:MAG: cation diffusion facilitator family transporter [Hyphomicrobiaceae bacterium]